MGTPIYNFATAGDEDDVGIDTAVNSAVQSIEDNLPHRFVTSVANLDLMSGSMYPNGQIAVLTADSSGVKAGSQFTRAGGKWYFSSGTMANVATFIAALTSNIGTQQGATFYDQTTSSARIFINTTGSSVVAAASSSWINIPLLSTTKKLWWMSSLAYKVTDTGAELRGQVYRKSGTFGYGESIILLPAAIRPTAGIVYMTLQGTANSLGNCEVGPTSGIGKGNQGYVVLRWPVGRRSMWYSFDGVKIPL